MVRLQESLCSIPVIQPPDSSMHADIDARSTKRCTQDGAIQVGMPDSSRYFLDWFGIIAHGPNQGNPTHHRLNLFGLTINGEQKYGFCLDHDKDAPSGSYANLTITEALPKQTDAQRCAIAFVIANTPDLPTADDQAADYFTMLGVDPAGLNGWDAYAVTQAVIWAIQGTATIPDAPILLPGNNVAGFSPMCSSTDAVQVPNPKADRLVQAAGAMFSMSSRWAAGDSSICGAGGGSAGCNLAGGGTRAGSTGGGSSGSGSTGAGGTCTCCTKDCGGNCSGSCSAGCACCKDSPCLDLGCQLGKVMPCITSTPPPAGSATYLQFVTCPNDIRELCGRVLLGPFKVEGNNNGNPDISFVPCQGCDALDLDVTDYCGRPKEAAIGEEFYIVIRPPCCRYCFDIKASMLMDSKKVYFFKKLTTDELQPLGVPYRDQEYKETSIHICIDICPELPPPPPPEPEPWWEHILVNNNNNNNNNDSSNNSSNLLNSLVSNLLNSLLSSNLSGNMMGGGAFPGGAFPGGAFPGGGWPMFPPNPWMPWTPRDPFAFLAPDPYCLLTPPNCPAYQCCPLPVPCCVPPPCYPPPADPPPVTVVMPSAAPPAVVLRPGHSTTQQPPHTLVNQQQTCLPPPPDFCPWGAGAASPLLPALSDIPRGESAMGFPIETPAPVSEGIPMFLFENPESFSAAQQAEYNTFLQDWYGE
jgi:hypothetical protein